MLLDVLVAAEELGRLREITQVLIRFGFRDITQRMGLVGLLQRAGTALHLERTGSDGPEAESTARRVRCALESLGPTFVKLGQVLATRGDLLPPETIEELSRLQAGVASVSFEQLRAQLTEDLGKNPEDVFASLDTEPLAAGSIAQVHRAELPTGERVILKVRRPGIDRVVRADLRLLERLAQILESEVVERRRFRPRAIVRQFAKSMRAELDFSIEARNTRTIARNAASHADLVIPKIFEVFSSERLLVEEYIEGPSADAWIRGERPEGLDSDHEPKDLNVVKMLEDITRIVREDNLILPSDVAMLIKVFLTLEGFGRRLDPSFHLDEHVAPVARRMTGSLRSPRRMIASNWKDLRRLGIALPRDLRKLVQRARRGGLRVELDLKRLEDFARQIDRSSNRMTVGLITSALIIGTSIAMTIDTGPRLFGLPVFGLIGFGMSFAIGLALLGSILRSGRR